MARGLLWSRRRTSREFRGWYSCAERIPDAPNRADALEALVNKRDNVEGASLFSILPKHRDKHLLRLLIAYQVMWDYLDSVSERGAYAGQANGRQLHRALVEALDPDAPISDYYRYHPWKDDGGYLVRLVHACRAICAELPCYRQVRPLMLEAVERCAVQSLNHEPEPNRRDTALKEWAEREFAGERTLEWFELTAAASAFTPHILLALAAEPSLGQWELAEVYSVYFPWVGLAIAMLDSYLDRVEDAVSESHSYISHYASETVALERLAMVIGRITRHVGSLPNGLRHMVLAEGIIAWHLSKDSVNTPATRRETRMLVHSSGPLTRLLLLIAQAWRATRLRPGRSSDIADALPPSLPLPTIVTTYLFWRSPLKYIKRSQTRYGKRFTLRIMNYPQLVLLLDPVEVKTMLTAPADVLHPGEGGSKIAPIVGEASFMLLDEDQHLNGRRAVTPALKKRIIEQESDWIMETVRRSIELWPQDTCLPLYPRLRVLTLEVILRRVFGGSELGSDDPLLILRDKVSVMLAATGSVVFPLPILRHGPGKAIWRRFLQDRLGTDELIHRLIDERSGGSGADHRDVLGTLLRARDNLGFPLSRCQLRDNVVTMLVSGHETTTSQLAWAFQLLAHNPKAQEQLIDEIDQDAGDAYLTATIQEVLRRRPVFPLTVPRVVKRPIEIGGWTYEPPTHLLGCIYLLHHDPAVYPEPDEFRPERFLEGQPSPYTYLPWGGGRRRCPGSHLALLEMKMVLRTVLETMTVNPASRRMERPRWRSVIVTPHAGSRVVLHQRECRSGGGRRTRRTTIGACPAPVRTADLAERGP